MEITLANQDNGITTDQGYYTIGEMFNAAASRFIFEDYRDNKADNTITRHKKELKNFSAFLSLPDIDYPNHGMETPEEWSGITFGVIEGYKKYMLNKGYSVSSTNQTIYIIKAYAALAGKAGYIDHIELAKIREIKGFKAGEIVHIDQKRKAAGTDTRISTKKETARNLTADQVEQLKYNHPDTLKGKRDALILTLFLDMGLRESELLGLTRESFDLESEMLHWYREKTNNRGHETMSKDIRKAARNYLVAYESVAPIISEKNNSKNKAARDEKKNPSIKSSLFVSVNQWGQVTGGLTMRGIVDIVRTAGKTVGIDNLSPHDLRHSMALRAYLAGIPLKSIQRRLGHSTVKTTERYIDIEALDRYNDFDREF